MADSSTVLGSTEIEILRFLSDHSPLSVGEVADQELADLTAFLMSRK